MKIQNQTQINSKERQRDKFKAQAEDTILITSLEAWARSTPTDQTEGRITYTYSIYLTWKDPGQDPVEYLWLCMYVSEALLIS